MFDTSSKPKHIEYFLWTTVNLLCLFCLFGLFFFKQKKIAMNLPIYSKFSFESATSNQYECNTLVFKHILY